MHRLVNFDALFFDLLAFVDQLFLLGLDSLTFTSQRGLPLFQIALLVLELLGFALQLHVDLVVVDTLLPKTGILFNEIMLEISQLFSCCLLLKLHEE